MPQEAPPPNTITLQIPGVQDIISVPIAESKELKRERLSRWMLNAATSPVPEPLRWIPQVINWLDNAQDFLYVALVAGIPLLRRLPTRFLPYLGWALLANDGLNLLTGILSAPLVPRVEKTRFLGFAKAAVAGKGALVASAESFLVPKRYRWIPFAIQGGQVIYSFTGWGLKLGTIMGTLSDSWWAAVRAFQGDHIAIRPPPAHDLSYKAAHVLGLCAMWDQLEQIANSNELSWMLNALAVAAGMLGAPNIPADISDRLEQLQDMQFPLFEQISDTTKAALADLGFPATHDQRPATSTTDPTPSYSTAVRVGIATAPDLDVTLAERLRPTTYDWPYGLQATELTQWTWDVFGGGHNFVVPTASPMERMLGISLETGVVPPFIFYPMDAHAAAHFARVGIEIQDIPDCQFLPSGQQVLPLYFKFPPAYPPPDQDPNVQLAHWCAIGLALWCGRPLLMPLYATNIVDVTQATCDMKITGWTPNTTRWGLRSMEQASYLVWGNVWRRNWFPDTAPTTTTGPHPSLCRPSSTDWPSLSGRTPELDPLLRILQAIPPNEETRLHIGETGKPFSPLLGRDWLDTYLRDHDPRRQGQPAYPPLTEITQPDTGTDQDPDWL